MRRRGRQRKVRAKPAVSPKNSAEPPSTITLSGPTLHAGSPARVTLRREPTAQGMRLAWAGAPVRLADVRVVRADHGVALTYGDPGHEAPTLDLVEHLLSAAGAMGASGDLGVVVEGSEIPLLDGGAARFVEALGSLGYGGEVRPRLRVVRPFEFTEGGARYALRPASEVRVAVVIEFDHPLIGRQEASWGGDPGHYARDIAPARTFGFQREHAGMLARGRARQVDLSAVVVFADGGLVPGCELRFADEPARHKLLDLVGDVTLQGGPLLGEVRAERPGHRTNLAMVAAARRAGALEEIG